MSEDENAKPEQAPIDNDPTDVISTPEKPLVVPPDAGVDSASVKDQVEEVAPTNAEVIP